MDGEFPDTRATTSRCRYPQYYNNYRICECVQCAGGGVIKIATACSADQTGEKGLLSCLRERATETGYTHRERRLTVQDGRMAKELRAPLSYAPANSAAESAGGGDAMHQDEDVQCTGRSRPVSFYDNFKVRHRHSRR